MLSDAEENLNTLMQLTGMPEDEASALLAFRVAIHTTDERSLIQFAGNIRELLSKTLVVVNGDSEHELEISIGAAATSPNGLSIWLTSSAMLIERGHSASPPPECDLHPDIAGISRKICACYAAGYAISSLLGDKLPTRSPDRFELKYANLDLPLDEIVTPLDLDDCVLAGAGGVANGFLWGLEELNPRGKLTIVDPKKVRAGNANRCLYFSPNDEGYKSQLLAERVRLPNVNVDFFAGTLRQHVQARADPRISFLVSTPDSRPARRSFQNELPRTVFDASTTGAEEIVVFSQAFPLAGACLSCIYPHVREEDQRDKHIADNLGLMLEEVKSGHITAALAEKLERNFPGKVSSASVLGMAFSSLHKALCGQQALLSPGVVDQAAAPFSFFSNLAGLLLALELYRAQEAGDAWQGSNSMHLNPWVEPHSRLRRRPRPRTGCDFCSRPESHAAMAAVWTE